MNRHPGVIIVVYRTPGCGHSSAGEGQSTASKFNSEILLPGMSWSRASNAIARAAASGGVGVGVGVGVDVGLGVGLGEGIGVEAALPVAATAVSGVVNVTGV